MTRHNTGREHWRVAGVREREVNEEMDCNVVMPKKSSPGGVTEFGKELESVCPEQAQPNHRHKREGKLSQSEVDQNKA